MNLRISYLFLILLGFIFSVLSYILSTIQGFEWLSAFISNTATGIVASLIIIFLVDQIIERNKEKERNQIMKIAIRRLLLPIRRHMTFLINMYKAAVQIAPSTLPTTYKDTFAEEYYKEISFLDFSSAR